MTKALVSAVLVQGALREVASEERARGSMGFFKTGPGEYGAGDRFLGVTVPAQRAIAKAARGLVFAELDALLASPWHEARLTALFVLVDAYERGESQAKGEVARFYADHFSRVNNWDLVDSSAWQILGRHVRGGAPSPLAVLARSRSMWERRIAMVSTFAWIKEGESEPACTLAASLLNDREDLMHKAVGWMLREVGKRVSVQALVAFLDAHADDMPRTSLRYAIERFPAEERVRWLARGKEIRTPSAAKRSALRNAP